MAYLKRGKEHHQWKGGIIKLTGGRIAIYNPKHPYATKDGYVRQARLVMEHSLGRYLNPEEVIHHINGKIEDDRIKNLQLFSSNSEHISKTLTGTKQKRNRNYKILKKIPNWVNENETIVLIPYSKRYICKRCDICKKLFWTKKRTERPITKTCSKKCLSILTIKQLKKDWKEGKYEHRKSFQFS